MDLAYQVYGSGAPLIILHGLFGARDNWHTLSRKLGERYQVFAIDQRNHGNSPHSDEIDYPTMAEDLRVFMETRGLQEAQLLGHSMGGKTAMRFTLSYPERVQQLIVADMAPKGYAGHQDELFDAMHALDLASFQTRQELDAALARDVPDAATRQLILKNVTRDQQGRFAWKMNLAAITANYAALLDWPATKGQYTGPTLFIRGERSDYIEDQDVPAIQALFPQAQIVTIPGAGHWVHAEAPAAFLRVVEDFLQPR